ncbi:hypothetical protein IMZ48_12650 [Candidatus Bathyarchaeota archaeon]|nr:hypothetical protein [Candidatus Bathyarchaeota archaeon]
MAVDDKGLKKALDDMRENNMSAALKVARDSKRIIEDGHGRPSICTADLYDCNPELFESLEKSRKAKACSS